MKLPKGPKDSKGEYGFHITVAEITIPKDYIPGATDTSVLHDWAVLRLSYPAPDAFAPLAIAGPDEPAPEAVRAAGFGQERSEVLTATSPCPVRSAPGEALLVTGCRLSHGFSGGPMVDSRTGRLVGISVAVIEEGGRTSGLAVPVSSVLAEIPLR